MPVTVLYISQELRTKALKANRLGLHMAWLQKAKFKHFGAFHSTGELPFGREGGYRGVPITM